MRERPPSRLVVEIVTHERPSGEKYELPRLAVWERFDWRQPGEGNAPLAVVELRDLTTAALDHGAALVLHIVERRLGPLAEGQDFE